MATFNFLEVTAATGAARYQSSMAKYVMVILPITQPIPTIMGERLAE
ncbi:MAG: hypothetical protein IM631_05445 [Cytophagales bacterium]|jgi:hypothetical protein|nr:hypothetical protein [Cytophagales bacterium]MCA6366769.1 hypothetical protein [Cytophagales bacterium]MCA6370826.1 hypothetical protein [Cytophagales bacterium]MCA6375736.1 hypothetical protein [Cytophagales bacterium]MCA6384687.1 hypothetical protein [Cytophagales bacterium]